MINLVRYDDLRMVSFEKSTIVDDFQFGDLGLKFKNLSSKMDLDGMICVSIIRLMFEMVWTFKSIRESLDEDL